MYWWRDTGVGRERERESETERRYLSKYPLLFQCYFQTDFNSNIDDINFELFE